MPPWGSSEVVLLRGLVPVWGVGQQGWPGRVAGLGHREGEGCVSGPLK